MERSEPTSHTSIYLWGPGLACVRLTVPAAMRLGELREAAAVRYAAATFDDQPPRLVHHGRELTSDLDGWLVTRATSLRSDSHFHMFPHDSWGVRPVHASPPPRCQCEPHRLVKVGVCMGGCGTPLLMCSRCNRRHTTNCDCPNGQAIWSAGLARDMSLRLPPPYDSWGVRPAHAGVEAPVLDSEPESALGAIDQRGQWPSELGGRPRLDVAESGGSPRRSSGHLAAHLTSPCDRLNFSSSDEE